MTSHKDDRYEGCMLHARMEGGRDAGMEGCVRVLKFLAQKTPGSEDAPEQFVRIVGRRFRKIPATHSPM